MGPMLKLFSMLISYTMVRKLISQHTLLAFSGMPECKKNSCPILDGGFSDNAPLTPIVSAASLMGPDVRPRWISSLGATSTTSTIKYLLGSGPFNIYTSGSVNVCPFSEMQTCTMVSKIRDIVVSNLPRISQQKYFGLGNAYQMWRPEVTLLMPYCGDPLTYDIFEGGCYADSVCDMWVTVLPSKVNKVQFTLDLYHVVFVMVFLQATPVSGRFVNIYMPEQMFSITYYENMDKWFPNFDAVAPQKGGIGFSNLAGNSFMDFMTYLNIRLVAYLWKTKVAAGRFVQNGKAPACQYSEYRKANLKTLSQPQFLITEQMQNR